MKPPFPSLTAEWHNDTYAAIDPTRPELSVKGKTVVISGGGAGIGRGFTKAFATAGAASIAILGRRQAMLDETKQEVSSEYPGTSISTHAVDVTDLAGLKQAAKNIGGWDVLISNAGYLPETASVVDSDDDDWWKAFEINVKGSYNLSKAFLPSRNSGPTIIGINAGSIQAGGEHYRNFTAYNSSKFAAIKFFEILAVENPDVNVVSMHPGIVETNLMKKSKMIAPSMDTLELPSHFAVWLCSQEAEFLRGRFVWTNWDVEQLKEKKNEIEGSMLLTANCIGWPFNA